MAKFKDESDSDSDSDSESESDSDSSSSEPAAKGGKKNPLMQWIKSKK